MEIVQKPSNSECYTPSSEPFRIHSALVGLPKHYNQESIPCTCQQGKRPKYETATTFGRQVDTREDPQAGGHKNSSWDARQAHANVHQDKLEEPAPPNWT
jgi:hypothetical protein